MPPQISAAAAKNAEFREISEISEHLFKVFFVVKIMGTFRILGDSTNNPWKPSGILWVSSKLVRGFWSVEPLESEDDHVFLNSTPNRGSAQF